MEAIDERRKQFSFPLSAGTYFSKRTALLGGWGRVVLWDFGSSNSNGVKELAIGSTWVTALAGLRGEGGALIGTQLGEIKQVRLPELTLIEPGWRNIQNSPVLFLLPRKFAGDFIAVFGNGEVFRISADLSQTENLGIAALDASAAAVANMETELAIGTKNGVLLFYRLNDLSLRGQISIADTPVSCLKTSRDEKRVFVASGHRVAVVKVANLDITQWFEGAEGSILSFLVSSTEDELLVSGKDFSLQILMISGRGGSSKAGPGCRALCSGGDRFFYISGSAEAVELRIRDFEVAPLDSVTKELVEATRELRDGQLRLVEKTDYHQKKLQKLTESHEIKLQELKARTNRAHFSLEALKVKESQLKELEGKLRESGEECIKGCGEAHSILFKPCDHLCVCEKCAEKTNICPLCDRAIVLKIKVFV